MTIRASIGVAVVLSLGCESVAHVDLEYVGKDGAIADDGATDAAVGDVGPLTVEDADALGEAGTCGCDITLGLGCCIQKNASFCTSANAACTTSGGVFLGCVSSVLDSECCWSGAPGSGSATHFAGSCANRPRGCASDADCLSGKCQVVKCGGITVGACGVTPVCP